MAKITEEDAKKRHAEQQDLIWFGKLTAINAIISDLEKMLHDLKKEWQEEMEADGDDCS